MENVKEGEIVQPEGEKAETPPVPNPPIELTPDQQQSDINARAENFKKELVELVQKHQIDIAANLNLVDLKYKK